MWLGPISMCGKTWFIDGSHIKVNIKSTKGAKCLLFGIAKDVIPTFAVMNLHRSTFVPWAINWLTSKFWHFVNQLFAHCRSRMDAECYGTEYLWQLELSGNIKCLVWNTKFGYKEYYVMFMINLSLKGIKVWQKDLSSSELLFLWQCTHHCGEDDPVFPVNN